MLANCDIVYIFIINSFVRCLCFFCFNPLICDNFVSTSFMQSNVRVKTLYKLCLSFTIYYGQNHNPTASYV